MRKQECVAMILAGGQGTRLGHLTKSIAKPAVPFGAKYRIIDFTLSNCRNSGINTVGVLTQYEPLVLNGYIGKGDAWDLDRKGGGVSVLSPYAKEKGAEWFKGTADAIYQHADFIDTINPAYLLVLSGDHIYKMDYSAMLSYHKQSRADATISVIEVPWEEASRFGMMHADEHGRIMEFQEKPIEPKSNTASMGIYIFNWKTLRRILDEDNKDSLSSHDFGKDVIPNMLNGGARMFAYPFKGYWRDVGEVQSYWQANMDLIAEKPELDLYDRSWPIFSVTPSRPPHFIGAGAKIKRSLVAEGCIVLGNIDNSVIFPGVFIGEGSSIKDSVVMPYVQIGAHTNISYTIVGRRCVIDEGAKIGELWSGEQPPITVIPENSMVPKDAVVGSNGIIPQKQVG